ncbi:MAG: hypothetical protein CL402_10520 [Acidiferrobacteraceae bacterium]|jgi:thiol:disulfide interchange protein DsbC|nr:hypothetical protein [Acidiferrobacteraceae bacterium]|tara:strand:+ start:18204 stop:19016 length:813 start_codon:yes stop_codon:yes gene_type:complete
MSLLRSFLISNALKGQGRLTDAYFWAVRAHRRIVNVALLAFSIFGISVCALADSVPEAVTQAVAQIFSDVDPSSVKASPIPNLFVVVIGTNVIYITDDGRYAISGDMIELESGKNLAEGVRSNIRKNIVSGLDKSGLIIYSPAQIRTTITVFTDITCPYCVRFHQEIGDLLKAGIRVQYAGFPRAGIPSKANDALVSVWCSDDPEKAMTNAKAGNYVEERVCDTSIDKHLEIAERIGIRGTPTIVLENGEIIPGFVPAEEIIRAIDVDLD